MGTIVNVIAIVIGGLLGIFAKKLLSDTLKDSVMLSLGLCVLLIGISGALTTANMMLVIISLVVGTIIGEVLDIDGKINKLSKNIEEKYFSEESNFAQGFMSASCLYVVGAMAIVGSIQSGLGNQDTLYVKSLMDGISSILLGGVYGVGVAFSAVPVLVYQGIITLAARYLADILQPAFVTELTAVGSMMIVAIGLNMLNLTKIKVANLLPALLILPLIMLAIIPFFTKLFS